MPRTLLLTGTAALAIMTASAAVAQDAPPPPPATDQTAAGSQTPPSPTPPGTTAPTTPAPTPAPTSAATFQTDQGQQIVVTGFRRNREDVLSGTSVVSGEELTRELRPTIGETLARQPGVSATSFGPNASRPVLRGFQGERIRILTDGIGSLDVSNTSVDHAVAINPLTAERIEVLRGPGALLFGSAAIGGVVNVIDARIPRRVPDEDVHVQGLLTYGSAANERSANGAINVPVGEHFIVHVDGNYSKTDDLRIGGYVLSPALRREAAASPDPDVQALASLRGRLPNSDGKTSDIAAGAAWIDNNNNVGFSINHFTSYYGIPVRYSLDPSIDSERVHIDLKQTRMDGRAEFSLGDGFIEQIRLRGGYSDYQHSEIGADKSVGTTFFNKGYEGRLEFVQATKGGFGGGFGAQYFHRDLNVVGDEKALPPNTTSQFGVFALESYSAGKLKAEVGGRYERQNVHGDADPVVGNPDITRTFDAFSGSVGASYGTSALRVGLNASHTERAPGAEELYINGPHPGTQAFEIGNPNLKKEVSNGLELSLHGSGDGYSFSASAYYQHFSHYIYEQATGAVEDELPVYQQRQASARYLGFEAEASARLATIGAVTINADALADYVRATVVNVGPAPRIPPLRMLAGLEAQAGTVNARVEVEKVTRQNRVAPLETPTNGYTMVNASVSFMPLRGHKEVNLTLSANNIFDVDARRHASFLKDYAPLAGRDIRLSARLSF
jgi:iron complex outermembrane receptor protein